ALEDERLLGDLVRLLPVADGRVVVALRVGGGAVLEEALGLRQPGIDPRRGRQRPPGLGQDRGSDGDGRGGDQEGGAGSEREHQSKGFRMSRGILGFGGGGATVVCGGGGRGARYPPVVCGCADADAVGAGSAAATEWVGAALAVAVPV